MYSPLQIPEYCRSMDEKEILENSFQLIFAFDEVVALGYRENVNLAQIRTFTEMDSHEERVYMEIKKVFKFCRCKTQYAIIWHRCLESRKGG